MITFNKFSAATAAAGLFLCTLGACSKNEVNPSKEIKSSAETSQNIISDEVKAQFTKLGFDVSDIRYIRDDNPLSGEAGKKNFLLENDIVITPENLQAMIGSKIHHIGAVNEQYHTTNLVTTPSYPAYRTIRVLGWNSGANALDTKTRAALTDAVNNYRALYGATFRLYFTLAFGANSTGYDIVVYKNGSGAGGVAGFPTGGNPYKWVQIFPGTSAYSQDVVEHVITHEIGHCVGMRHSDFFNRSLSCGGSAINEGSAGVGAIHVPETPTGWDVNSVMNSCFSSTETGEFGYYDRVSLRELY
ncbi:peptidase [Rhodocytophaga rosea]|uniref:Peptidase n=1 Tax=Rhodocytophaga rosea TaxID=2704465 RepID=A0A6C0GCA9_9BACT|nr:M57 family metalloprotease [Rhodocytophaga rosea]QHT65518.1 peptidase [Rhodocytophaga rosea]